MKQTVIFIFICVVILPSCKSKQTLELSAPINIEHKYVPEHSPNVFLTDPIKPKLEIQ